MHTERERERGGGGGGGEIAFQTHDNETEKCNDHKIKLATSTRYKCKKKHNTNESTKIVKTGAAKREKYSPGGGVGCVRKTQRCNCNTSGAHN